MNPIVKKYLQKQIFKQKGAIGSAKAVQFSYNALETKMKNLGLDINLIKSEKDLNQALGFVKSLEDQIFAKKFGDTLKKTDAEIIPISDPEKRLNPKKPILGGSQDEEDMLQKSIKKNIAAATEKGDFTGIRNQVLRDPDIAREFMLSKKFPFRRDTNVLSGEDAIPLAKKAKFDEEMGIKSVAPRDYSVEKLVSDFKKFGKASDDDIKLILGSGKSGQIPYVMDQYGMSYKDVINTLKRGDDLIKGLATGGRAGFKDGPLPIKKDGFSRSIDFSKMTPEEIELYKLQMEKMKKGFEKKLSPENLEKLKIQKQIRERQRKDMGLPEGLELMATGGRAGFKVGSPSKRAFLKVMGGLAATVAAIKSGLIGTPKKEVAKQVIKESAKDVANAPPQYFFDLANKIKLLGKESKVKPKERTSEYNYTGKDGSEYTLTEDIGTGEMQIVKEKTGVGTSGEKTFDTIEDQTVMEYKPGKSMADESTEGIPADQYDEYRVNFDADGTPADADDISEIIKKEIIEEASEIPEKKIKRAGGGVAYMLGE